MSNFWIWLRLIGWALAFSSVAALLVFIGILARRGALLRKPLVNLQAERARQLAQLEQYEQICGRMQELAERVHKERTQIFSMLEYCRGRGDFVVTTGERIVCCKNFYDSRQCEPAVFFYLPPGEHELLFTSRTVASREEMSRFMFDREPTPNAFDSIPLAGEEVYEIRFFKITPEEPRPTGFRLIGPGVLGEDEVIAEFTLPFPITVVGVGGGYGASRLNCLPDQQHSMAKRLPGGRVAAATRIAQQAFRMPTGDDGPDRPGPRVGIRFFVRSVAAPHAARSVAVDQLVEFMRQPAPARVNMDDLFSRASAFQELAGLAPPAE